MSKSVMQALMDAVRADDPEAVAAAVAAGANPNQYLRQEHATGNVFEMALSWGKLKAARQLRALGGLVSRPGSALGFACFSCSPPVVEWTLTIDARADLVAGNFLALQPETPGDARTPANKTRIAVLLLDKGASPSQFANFALEFCTPLVQTLADRRQLDVDAPFAAGATVSLGDWCLFNRIAHPLTYVKLRDGSNSLYTAVTSFNADGGRALQTALDAGFPVDTALRPALGSPAFAAARAGIHGALAVLLAAGASPLETVPVVGLAPSRRAPVTDTMTLLFAAAASGSEPAVDAVVRALGPALAQETAAKTAFSYSGRMVVNALGAAVLADSIPVVNLLQGVGADPNALVDGQVPLTYVVAAAREGTSPSAVAMANALLAGGASPDVACPAIMGGMSPRAYALNFAPAFAKALGWTS